MRSGKTIGTTSPADPHGFGIGIAQATVPKIGTVYEYEGGTFGYRVLYVYLPTHEAIVTVALNSNGKHDGINVLAKSILATLKRAGRLSPRCDCARRSPCATRRKPCVDSALFGRRA
jgi:D-alanyl-D-alanine carboxypeptidase